MVTYFGQQVRLVDFDLLSSLNLRLTKTTSVRTVVFDSLLTFSRVSHLDQQLTCHETFQRLVIHQLKRIEHGFLTIINYHGRVATQQPFIVFVRSFGIFTEKQTSSLVSGDREILFRKNLFIQLCTARNRVTPKHWPWPLVDQ